MVDELVHKIYELFTTCYSKAKTFAQPLNKYGQTTTTTTTTTIRIPWYQMVHTSYKTEKENFF